ncbi:MAG: DUF3617 domain-containing protein [Deltaproteobacteria bacterium]|nr:MAG: DUF3617 domain-containing protein [Deltaproteobacteria bacterium]
MKNVARQTVVLFALILFCAAGTAHPAGVDMKEGNWEISSETSMVMEGMSMPPMSNKSTYCLTREDPVPAKDKDCKVVNHKVSGNKVSWRMECKKGEGEGEISYHGTTYNGFMKMKSVEDGETMTMNMKLAGKYLGPCPKGQKSGATGETAKQMAAGQQAAVQGQKQLAQIQAEQAAVAKKTEAFIKRSVVPADEPGACGQAGFARTPECQGKAGDLNLKPGEYEITLERGSRVGTTYMPVEEERKTVCLTEDAPVPAALSAGPPAHVKRGKERITWTGAAEGQTTKGGILYRGNSLEGAMTNTMDLGAGQQSFIVTKVTGRRIGDGNCIAARDYTAERRRGKKGRDYTAKKDAGDAAKKGAGDSAAYTDNILKNPVKGIRNLLGF